MRIIVRYKAPLHGVCPKVKPLCYSFQWAFFFFFCLTLLNCSNFGQGNGWQLSWDNLIPSGLRFQSSSFSSISLDPLFFQGSVLGLCLFLLSWYTLFLCNLMYNQQGRMHTYSNNSIGDISDFDLSFESQTRLCNCLFNTSTWLSTWPASQWEYVHILNSLYHTDSLTQPSLPLPSFVSKWRH